jgi:hypothetical protein
MAAWLGRHWFAVTFVGVLVVAESVAWALSAGWRLELASWASTNVINLESHPAGALGLSAFVTDDRPLVWPVVASMGLFSAERLLGPLRLALLCLSAHVLGTLVSEGIVAYRVQVAALPGSALSQLDVGPSYILVAAVTVAALAGRWPSRLVALAALLALSPFLFTGIARLDVAAVGHAVSVVLGAVAAALYYYGRARRSHRSERLLAEPLVAASRPAPLAAGARTAAQTVVVRHETRPAGEPARPYR